MDLNSPARPLLGRSGVNISQAFFAGVIGAAVAIVISGAGRAAGVDVGLEDFLGETWVLGLGLLLLAGGVVALAYGFGYERLAGHADVRWLAVGFGAVHAAIALHLFATVGALRSVTSAGGPTFQLPVASVLVIAHLAFAVVTGILYRVTGTEEQSATAPDFAAQLAPARVQPSRRGIDRAA
jgi:hypothetical protein